MLSCTSVSPKVYDDRSRHLRLYWTICRLVLMYSISITYTCATPVFYVRYIYTVRICRGANMSTILKLYDNNNFQAKGKERQWLKHQSHGDLDDAKLIEAFKQENVQSINARGEKEPEVNYQYFM